MIERDEQFLQNNKGFVADQLRLDDRALSARDFGIAERTPPQPCCAVARAAICWKYLRASRAAPIDTHIVRKAIQA